MTAWRLIKQKYQAEAFSGMGAASFGGRWNSIGKHAVYVSESKALSILEILMHAAAVKLLKIKFVLIPVEFELDLVEEVGSLPPDWQSNPIPKSTQEIGDDFLKHSDKPVLEVPSSICKYGDGTIHTGYNYILNPNHKLFTGISILEPITMTLDDRF